MPPKILLFGASGCTGKYVAKFALEAGHEVLAFVRSEQKIRGLMNQVGVNPPNLVDQNLRIIVGDLTNADQIRDAVRQLSSENGDVIINCAGKPKGFSLCGGKPLIPDVVRTIVQTMRECGLKRFLNQAGAMTTDKRLYKDPSYYPKKCMVCCCGPLLCIRGMVTDNSLLAPYIYRECDDIEWIVTRPGYLVEKPSKCSPNGAIGSLGMGVVGKEPFSTTFVDLGQWTAKAVFDDTLVHTSPVPGYVKIK